MSETLSYRAAKYFGMEGDPRTSVPVGDGKCIIVTHRAGRLVMAIYEEHGRTQRGVYVNFTDARYEKLFDAIDHHWSAA